MGKFAEALNRTAETIVRPPPAPIGLYLMRIVKLPDPTEPLKGKDGTNYAKLTIPVEVVSPYEVDEDDLEHFSNGGKNSVAGLRLRSDFLFNEDDDAKFENTLVRLKEFLEKCGIDTTTGSMGDWLNESPNAQFIGEVKHRADPNDDKTIYAELGRATAYT